MAETLANVDSWVKVKAVGDAPDWAYSAVLKPGNTFDGRAIFDPFEVKTLSYVGISSVQSRNISASFSSLLYELYSQNTSALAIQNPLGPPNWPV